MESNLESQAKRNRKRHDGTDASKYEKTNKWSHKRWAWEFLKRNVDFIADCKKYKRGTNEEKQEIAQKYGLKSFKSSSEPYAAKSVSGYPKFRIGSVSGIKNIEPNLCTESKNYEFDFGDSERSSSKSENIYSSKKVRSSLGIGQVFIRFDLESVTMDERALKKQLTSAEVILKKWLKLYAENRNIKLKSHRARVDLFPKYIRILDLLHAKKTPLDCANILYPSKVKEKCGPDEMRESVKDEINAAKDMASDGYRYLILSSKKSTKV